MALPEIFYDIVRFNALYLIIASLFAGFWLIERVTTVIDENFQKWIRLIGSVNVIVGLMGFVFIIPSTAIIIVDGPKDTLDWSVIVTMAVIIMVLSIGAVKYIPKRSLISLGTSIAIFALITYLTTQDIFIPGLSILMFTTSMVVGSLIQDILDVVTSIFSSPFVTIPVAALGLIQALLILLFQKTVLTLFGIYI